MLQEMTAAVWFVVGIGLGGSVGLALESVALGIGLGILFGVVFAAGVRRQTG